MKHCLALACCAFGLLTGCGSKESAQPKPEAAAAPVYFKPDPATAGTLEGTIHMTGRHPVMKPIDMTSDPACVEAHHGPAIDESVVVNKAGMLADVFVYIKSGLEGKTFEPPATPVTIDQRGCWFRPRIFGIQIGQVLKVTNSDPVTHNIHPLAKINREWNHSQGAGDPPLSRKFTAREVMIRVKCNIHSWMRAYIGVLEHPYFASTGTDGKFEIRDVPPGDYVIGAWHETLGTQEQKITVGPSGKARIDFTFKGE
ncbi:MAG TPA: carboxypeptidase regulatory-like domain-containing protein [Bryobacteraceae bacterium]|jgi:plastocyanin